MRLLKVGAAVALVAGLGACTAHTGASAHLGNNPVTLVLHAKPLQPDRRVTTGQMQTGELRFRQVLEASAPPPSPTSPSPDSAQLSVLDEQVTGQWLT